MLSARTALHPSKRTTVALLLLGAVGLCRVAKADELSSPAPQTTESQTASPTADTHAADTQALLQRQAALEAEVAAQRALLDQLRRTVALPDGHEPTPTGNLAVNPNAVKPDDPELTAPLAGYSDRNFFLRDRHSWFVLVPKGRVQVDYFNFLSRPALPPGVIGNSSSDPRTSLHDTVFIKRARLGLAGTIARGIDFRVEEDFASTPGPGQYGTLADASVVINYIPWLRLEAGQFYVPFTAENATSENFTDFMEKSATVRFVQNSARDLGGMLFGDLPSRFGRWYFGVFNGEGQNSKNLDNQPALASRLFVTPFGLIPHRQSWLDEIWVGGSIWWQQASNLGGSQAPSTSATAGDLATVTTQGGFTLFNPVYADGVNSAGSAVRAHLAPDGTVFKYAIELNVPIWTRFGLRSEYAHQRIDLRQYQDANNAAGVLTRSEGGTARLDGYGFYVEAYAWIGGPVNVDHVGLYQIPHWAGYVPPPPPRWAIQLTAKYERVAWEVSGLPAKDPAGGHYAVDIFEAGGSLWVTRHARVMINYLLNSIGDLPNAEASSQQQKNIFFHKKDNELLLRLDVHV